MVEDTTTPKLAKASTVETYGDSFGSFVMPTDSFYSALGLTPEKLIVPTDYHQVLKMIYDFYKRGGIVTTVVNRLAELSVTEIRNGQRKTTNEQNAYFDAVLSRQPSRLTRFLRNMALEYFISGMVVPRLDFEDVLGSDLHPKLIANKMYTVPVFDMYPANLVYIYWAGWGKKEYYLKVPDADVKLIRNGGSKIKDQQLKYQTWINNYPSFVSQIVAGSDKIILPDVDPILRKETSDSQYPNPYLQNILEPLIHKQQLRRMDFAVSSRVINAILLVQEGNDNFPLTEETRDNLDELKNQILARSGNPRLMERIFMLFSNHTTQLNWITPDVQAMLDQEKYKQINEEIAEGLGFSRVLITGENRGTGNTSEVSTWAIQPMMEDLRSMMLEFITYVYETLSKKNKFKNVPAPAFKPIRLQDFVKSASVFAQLFTEGSLSRTTRTELVGVDFETEVELMKDEAPLMKGLPAFPPMPYSPLPPMGNSPTSPTADPRVPPKGRPPGSKNVPINNRNTGIKPSGQKPVARIKQAMTEEQVVDLLLRVAETTGIEVDFETLENTPELELEEV